MNDLRKTKAQLIAELEQSRLDVIESRKITRTVRQSLDAVQATIDAVTSGMLTVDQDNRITVFNQQFVKMWSIPDDVLTMRDDEPLIDYITDQLRDPQAFIRTGKELQEQPRVLSHDFLSLKDGRIFERRSQPQRINGKIVGRVWDFRDVTRQKENEAKLYEANQLQRTILKSAGYALISTTTDGLITTFNPMAERMLGYRADELIGKETPAIFHDLDEMTARAKQFSAELGYEIKPEFEIFTAKAFRNMPNEYEWTYIRKDGTRFPVWLAITALRDAEGNPLGLIGIARDITDRKQTESRLGYAEQVVESSPAVLFRWRADENWSVEYVSENIQQFGYSAEELRSGKVAYASLVHPDDLERVGREVGEYSASGVQEFAQTYRIITKGGDVRWTDDSTAIIRDAEGNITHYQGIVVDVTEQYLLNERLRQATQVVESSPVVLFRWRADENWSVEYVSENIRQFGYSAEELRSGKVAYASLVHPDDLERVGREVGEYSASGVQEFAQTYRIITKDGDVRWTDDSTMIIRDAEGNITHYQGIVVDVTERKVAEIERERLLSIIESSVDFIAMADPDGVGTYLNPGGLAMTGYTSEEFYGGSMGIHDFYPALPQTVLKTAVEEGNWSGETFLKCKYGHEILVSQNITVLKGDEGQLIGFSSIARDLSEQRKAENLAIVSEISVSISGILNTQEMLQSVVDLIKERFALYHVHIYLLDDDEKNLLPVVGAGEMEKVLARQGWQIAMDAPVSMVAQSARTRQGVLANDVATDVNFLPNPYLPDEAAELAVPIIVGEKLLGVLDVQADVANRFTQDDVYIQSTLAGQIAIALQNTRQHEQMQLALDELTRLQRTITREGWQAFMTTTERRLDGYFSGRGTLPITQKHELGKDGSVAESNAVSLTELKQDQTAVIVPMKLRGTVLGGVGLRAPAGKAISAENQELLQAVSLQVTEALERARLLEVTELGRQTLDAHAAELSLLNEISEVVSAQLDLESLFRATGQRIREALSATSVFFATYDQTSRMIDFPYYHSEEEGSLDVPSRLADDTGGFTARIILSRQPFVFNRGGRSEKEFIAQGGRLDGRTRPPDSFLGVPMIVGEDLIGVIGVNSYREQRTYNEDDQRLLSTLAGTVGVAMQNVHQFEATQARARREQMLREISRQVNTAVDPESILHIAAREIGRMLGWQTHVYLVEPDEAEAIASAENGQP